MLDPVVRRMDLLPGRLYVAALLAVAAFALLISFVSASAWHIEPDLRFLAAIGGTMLNLVTGAVVFFAVRLRRASSGVFDEDLARREPQDAARAAEDQDHEAQVQQA